MNYKEIYGDLIFLTKLGNFDVIAHGCNCFCTQKSGIAPQMVKAFGTDTFEKEQDFHKGDINKLGTIDYNEMFIINKNVFFNYDYGVDEKDQQPFIVINTYTQFMYGTDKVYFDYSAFTLCMRKINHQFKGKRIGLPLIGCGLAGGIWDKNQVSVTPEMSQAIYKDVKTIIQEELKDCDVTIVHYKK